MFYTELDQNEEDLSFEQFVTLQECEEEIIEEAQLINDIWY